MHAFDFNRDASSFLGEGADTEIVRRSRVVECFAKASERRIVLVGASAGYGKTVALQQFLRNTWPAARLPSTRRATTFDASSIPDGFGGIVVDRRLRASLHRTGRVRCGRASSVSASPRDGSSPLAPLTHCRSVRGWRAATAKSRSALPTFALPKTKSRKHVDWPMSPASRTTSPTSRLSRKGGRSPFRCPSSAEARNVETGHARVRKGNATDYLREQVYPAIGDRERELLEVAGRSSRNRRRRA